MAEERTPEIVWGLGDETVISVYKVDQDTKKLTPIQSLRFRRKLTEEDAYEYVKANFLKPATKGY